MQAATLICPCTSTALHDNMLEVGMSNVKKTIHSNLTLQTVIGETHRYISEVTMKLPAQHCSMAFHATITTRHRSGSAGKTTPCAAASHMGLHLHADICTSNLHAAQGLLHMLLVMLGDIGCWKAAASCHKVYFHWYLCEIQLLQPANTTMSPSKKTGWPQPADISKALAASWSQWKVYQVKCSFCLSGLHVHRPKCRYKDCDASAAVASVRSHVESVKG